MGWNAQWWTSLVQKTGHFLIGVLVNNCLLQETVIELALSNDKNTFFWKAVRNLSEPKGRDDTSPHEKLKVELLESYQSPRQVLACTPCP